MEPFQYSLGLIQCSHESRGGIKNKNLYRYCWGKTVHSYCKVGQKWLMGIIEKAKHYQPHGWRGTEKKQSLASIAERGMLVGMVEMRGSPPWGMVLLMTLKSYSSVHLPELFFCSEHRGVPWTVGRTNMMKMKLDCSFINCECFKFLP